MPNPALVRLLATLQAIVYVLLPSTVAAATITLDSTLNSVPMLAWLMVFIVSSVSGLAALLNRLKVDVPPRLPYFVASHMLGSWVSGALVFFVGEAFDLMDFVEVVAIALGAYGGATFIDRFSSAFTNRLVSETERGSYAPKTGKDA